jgi:hypothetical protein
VNEFANLPADEFERQKTGALDPAGAHQGGYARGLLPPRHEDIVDEGSEQHFDQFRFNRAALPGNYSSVDLMMGDKTPSKSLSIEEKE